jgi:DNA-directed DNA polymerase III PolC
MNHVSPCNHPESALSGSTVESMIKRTKDLGLEYFATTDVSNLSSIIRGYNHAKKSDIKFIAGIEILFKDNSCDIVADTESSQIKYFKLLIHAKDQAAYQKIVRMTSDSTRQKVTVGEERLPTFNWADLESLAKSNVTACTSNIEDMVSKHLLVGRPDLSVKYYRKLKEIFKDNLYLSIIPYSYDQYWESIVELILGNDKVIQIPAFDRVETDHFKRAKAIDLTRRGGLSRHKKLLHIYSNKIRYAVAEEFQEIHAAKLLNDFQPLPGGDVQTKANKLILALADKFGDLDRVLINNNANYATEGDQVVQSMKLGEDERFDQHQHMRSIEDCKPYLKEKLGLTEEGIYDLVCNSNLWAKNFDGFELKYNYRLPDPGENPKQQLMDVIEKVGRMDWDNEVYVKQFNEELALLNDNDIIDLIPYFLPVVKVYDSYKENGYLTGPARGSAGGFLISYLIGITHLDPIRYELSTSRFLTLDRVQQGNLPDIDCDLESRDHLVGKDGNGGYLFNEYGDKAAQISTRTLLRIKSAILDANRFMNKGTVENEIKELSKSLPTTPQGVNDYNFVFGYEEDGSHVDGLIDLNEDLKKYSIERPAEWDLVVRALSLSRQFSRHACAYVIADCPITDIVPTTEVGGVTRVTSYEAKYCEWAGLIKYDFLIVKAIKTARVCCDYINKKNNNKSMAPGYFTDRGMETFVWDLPVDQSVFKELSAGKTETIFQLHSATATPLVMDIKPESVVDCAVITSLGRPGPLDFFDDITGRNMAQEYGFRKRGQSSSKLAIMDEMLPETYGVLVFQEQVTKLAKELAGMSVIDAENVRIAVGKKKIKLIKSLKPIFIEGAAKRIGVKEATEVWDMMETFARYGFNKSHAVAYSIISYAGAYFKKHYPLEWWAAVLSTSDTKKINEEYYKYVRDMILPPDINVSTEEISIDYNLGKIRSKLSMISGLGKKSAAKIMKGRPYHGIKDFIEKKVAGPSLTRKLIHVGVLDSMFDDKRTPTLLHKMQVYEDAVEQIDWERKILDYCEKIEEEEDEKKLKRLNTNRQKCADKGPKKGKIDHQYIMLTPKKDFLMKKGVFPTMNLNLNKVLLEDSDVKIIPGARYSRVCDHYGRETPMVNGEQLQRIDDMFTEDEIKAACPAYIINVEEFTFAGGTKKALKLILDSSGYVSEKVLWADWDSGELIYPKSLKKGSIAYFFYKRSMNKKGVCYTNINQILVEEEAI